MDNNELYHYGVVGMRWGVRKDPERTRARREARAARYDKRAARYARKSSKYRAKAHRGFLRTSAHAEYLRQSDRYDYKSKKAAEKAARIRSQQSRDLEKASKNLAKAAAITQRSMSNKVWGYGDTANPGLYKNQYAVGNTLKSNRKKAYSYIDKATALDPNAKKSNDYQFVNQHWADMEKAYKDVYGRDLDSVPYNEIIDKRNMKHSGINMRDVMEFAEYLDDCGATLQHAAIRKSRSKYKGGFVNGKNTSEYNHDYYIHNKDKWKDNKKAGLDHWAHYFNNHYIDTDYYYDFKDGKVPAGHPATGSADNSHLELVNNHWVVMPNGRGRARRSSATRSLDPNEPMGTMYTLNNGKTYHYSSQNLHGTGSGGKKDPEFNERNRPHSRKRAEATASGKVFRRPEVYNPLTGEYQSYTLGRGHGNNGLTPNPTKRSSGVTRSNNSDEEREPKNRVGKYRTTNTRRKTRVVYPSSKDKKGTRYTDRNGLEWVKGSDDTWTTMRNNRVAIKTTKELKYGSPAQAAYNRLKRKVFKR